MAELEEMGGDAGGAQTEQLQDDGPDKEEIFLK